MNKSLLIFDKSTFINIKYLYHVVERYKYTNISLVIVATLLCWMTYFSQETVFLRETGFIVNSTEPAKNSMLALSLSGSSKEVGISDLRSMINAWNFKDELIKRLRKTNSFSDLIFFDSHKNRLAVKSLIASCQEERECVDQKLTKVIDQSYKIIKKPSGAGYALLTHSYDEESARVLEKEVIRLVEEFRLQALSKNISNKVDGLEKMLKEKQGDLGLYNVTSIQEKIRIADGEISDLEKAIEELQLIHNREKAKLFAANLKYKQLMKKENIALETSDRDKTEKLRALESRVRSLNENIDLLRMNNENLENDGIIKKLRAQVRAYREDIKRLGPVKSGVSTFESAQKNKNEILPELVIEMKVLEENEKKLSMELKNLSEKRNNLLKTKNELGVKLENLGPEIEVLNIIKKQYSKNVVQSSTLRSDLEFAPIRPESSILQTHSLRKMILLNIFFASFLVSFVSLFRCLFDQRIYTSEELSAMCPGLKVLGHSSRLSL